MTSLTTRQRDLQKFLLQQNRPVIISEIAEAMELSTQAVKSLLSRARTNLRDILEPYVQSGQLPQGVLAEEHAEDKD